MKIAIISDMHFGDDHCMLLTDPSNPSIGPMYERLLQATGQDNDYLVLLGDVFDFSIASYEQAYRCGQVFFRQIQKDHLAKEMIYIAGNHDADIWHIVQHQRSVINRIRAGKLPEPFKHAVPGILDDRRGSANPGLILDRTTPQAMPGKPRYGGLFLDAITDPPMVFNFVYPNLYIVTDDACVLVTHGHYLEAYWSFLGECLQRLAYDDLRLGEVDIAEMVEMNFPLNQLACTGIGQAGVLTPVVRQVQQDVKGKDLVRVKKYLDRLETYIDDLTDYRFIKEWVADYLARKAKQELLAALTGAEQTRYSQEFLFKPEVRERFKRYYSACLLELGDLNARTELNIPAPWRVIFGHTHQPIAWNDTTGPKLDTVSSACPKLVTLHNSGGWLQSKGAFCGAEVFIYQTGIGFRSVSIR